MLSLKEFKQGCIEEALRSLRPIDAGLIRWDNASRRDLESDCADFVEAERNGLVQLEAIGSPSATLGTRFWRYRNGLRFDLASDASYQAACRIWGPARLFVKDGRIQVAFDVEVTSDD